jgi:serine/threonine-protein kinase
MPDSGLAIVGKYRILDLVGEGAMGVVYRGVDTVLNRTVALKVMSESVARQQDLRDRFLREAQAAGSLQHPNVVTIYDFGEIDGHLFIAMEYVEGMDLERMLAAREPLTLQQRLDIAIDILTGLCFAHRHGIVHRDVKPANIRITEDGRAKVMDFGVAYLDSSKMTQTGMMMGTPSYMAPEQVVGGKITAATDIFAMGSLLYELLTGARPFEGTTLHNTLYKIVSEDPPPIREVMPGLPTALEAVVKKALEKDPDRRYQDALEMADALAAVRAALDAENRTSSTVSLRRSVETAIAAQVKDRMRRRTIAVVAAMLLLAAVVGGAAWIGMREGSDADRIALAEPGGDTLEVRAPVTSPAQPADDTAAPAAQQSGGPATISERSTATQPAATETQRPVQRRPEAPPVVQPRPQQRQVAPTADTNVPAETARALPPIELPRTPVTAPPPAPVVTNPVPAPELSDTTLIGHAVASYARAIESRDIAAIRRVYPAMTPQQQQSFEQFFDATSDLRVTFRVTGIAIAGSTADTQVSGTYAYQTSGRAQQQPVSFSATLRKDGGVWRFVAVR